MKKSVKADLALLFVTLTWGISFILTKRAIAEIEVFNFLAIRFLVAFFIAALFFARQLRHPDPASIRYGLMVGFVLFCGYGIQTIGMLYTTISNTAFISGLNVVLVPIFSALLFRTKIEPSAKLGVLVAVAGLALLTLKEGLSSFNIGDFYNLLAAGCYALHIILMGHYTRRTHSVQFAITQIAGVGIYSLLTSLVFETPSLDYPMNTWLSLLFLAVFCTAAAFVIQSIAQRYTSSTHTALIYINEPVFAAIFGYFIVGEILGVQGVLGGLLMLMGILIAELDFKLKGFAKHA